MGVRIAVIGAGVMGADHARTLERAVSGAEVVAVFDADPSRAARVSAECGIAPRVADAFGPIADRSIDAVLVATPDETHAALVLACIAAEKPVLCEKPLAATIGECRDIMAAEIAAGGRFVQVGFMRRFDPGYMAMKQSLAEGRLGLPLFMHCVHRNAVAPHFITSDLVITNSTVHEIDVSRWLLGDEFASAMVVTPRAPRGVDGRNPQFVVLETRSGVVVDVEAFLDAGYGYDVRAELVCESGTISLAPLPPTLERHAGREGFHVVDDWRARFAAAYRNQLQAWVDSIVSGRPTGSSAWDGYAATATAEACLASLRSGSKAQINLEPRNDLYA